MTTSRAMQAEQTRLAVIRTARRLFAEQGYDATSLQQIANATGVQKANVYYYFKTKGAILAELLESMLAPLRALIGTLESEADRSARARTLASGFAAAVVHSYRTEGPLNLGDPMLRRDRGATAELDSLALTALALLFGDEPTPDQRAGFWTILDLGPALRRLDDLDDEELRTTIERLCLRAIGEPPAEPIAASLRRP